MLELDNENKEYLLLEKFDNIFNNFEEKNLIDLSVNKLDLNRKDFINKNILEKNEFKVLEHKKRYYSKSSEQKRKANNKKNKKRINFELLDIKDNKNDEIDYYDLKKKKKETSQ